MTDQIFISYSKKDSDFAHKLADNLEAVGFKIWIDKSIGGGDLWRETIEKNLKAAGEVIIVVSLNSMASEWVKHEGSLAYGWEKQLFPILIEPVEALPPWLEEYQWIDFVSTPYEVAFDALVDALTPPNPIQDLLDQQVYARQQEAEHLISEAILRVIEENRETLVISTEAQELVIQSQQVIAERQQREKQLIQEKEAARQRELDQAIKMSEVERERAEILQQKLDLEQSHNLLAVKLAEWVTFNNFLTDIKLSMDLFTMEIKHLRTDSNIDYAILEYSREEVIEQIESLIEWSKNIKSIGVEPKIHILKKYKRDLTINFNLLTSTNLSQLENQTLRSNSAIQRLEFSSDKEIKLLANELSKLTQKSTFTLI